MRNDVSRPTARDRAIERLLAGEGMSPRRAIGASVPLDPAEYARASDVWDELGMLKEEPDYADLWGKETLREKVARMMPTWAAGRPWLMPAAASGVGAALIAMLLFLPQTRMTHFATQVAQLRQVHLVDGTQIALGARSSIDVAYTDRARTVSMQPGEAFFEVAKDPSRPFTIDAGGTRITVVGTKFNVKYDTDSVRVAVLEGIVKLTPPSRSAFTRSTPLALPAGSRASVSTEAGGTKDELAIAAIGPARPDAWRKGQLDYVDVPLSEIIADVNRYVPGTVRLGNAALADERITASFRADQAAQFIRSLPSLLPVRVAGKPGQELVIGLR